MSQVDLPTNRLRLSLADVVRETGGTLAGPGGDEIVGVVTDTRGAVAGSLFVALVGERFDAHDFAIEAATRGAAALLVERVIPGLSLPQVQVASTLAALGALARFRRRTWGGQLLAVAGSAGKTTTRAALAAVLEAALPGAVHYARGNFNNLVGVPLVLLGLPEQARVAVVEVGTNRRGEVSALASISEPNVGIVTLVGYEHSAGLGDLDGVEAEEGSLYSALAEGGSALGNVDDPRVARQLDRARARRIGYGKSRAADYRLRVVASSASGSELEISRGFAGADEALVVQTPVLGDAGAYAATAAVAAAETVLGRALDGRRVSEALSSSTAAEAGRLSPTTLADGTLLLDDTYNANPASVESSLATAAELARQRSAPLGLVLGEMRELGSRSRELHERIGRAAAQLAPAWLIGIGADAEFVCEAARALGVEVDHVADADAAAARAAQRMRPGDVVLVKASRSLRAERVVSHLKQTRGPRA